MDEYKLKTTLAKRSGQVGNYELIDEKKFFMKI